MEPNQSFDPGQAQDSPQVYGTPPAAGAPGQGQPVVGGKEPGKKKLLLLLAGLLLLLAVVVIVVMVASSGRETQTSSNAPESNESPTNPAGPQPADALDVEEASNSIIQDISNLNDEQDFPEEELSDDNLEL